MWDNACVLHRADHSGVVGDRVMHRGMVAATDPPRGQRLSSTAVSAPAAASTRTRCTWSP